MISTRTLQLAFQGKDITSTTMNAAIEDWFQLYYLQEATKTEDPCQQIPFTIVRKLTKATFSEYMAHSKNEFAGQVLKALQNVQGSAAQHAFIGGMCMLKPLPEKTCFSFSVVRRDKMLIFGRNHKGQVTDIGTWERTVQGRYYYTLLERRTVDANGFLTIKNVLYRSYTESDLGSQIPLSTLEQYANFQEVYTFREPIGSVGLIPVTIPVENCVDGGEDAVSVYAAATGLIHNINRNEAQLNGEFERGKSKIMASADMFKKNKDGARTVADDVFVTLDEDPETMGITIFSPALRETSYLARKQDYLRSVENIIGLKRGLLSEVEAVERTAKEITSSEGDYNLTITDLQKMWESSAREALRVCGILGRLYQIPGATDIPEDAVVFNWGNGVLFDEEKTRAQMLSEVQAGLLQPERYVGFVYKQPCETAAQREKIRKDYMPQQIEEE